MGIAYHTIYSPDGAALNLFDRATMGTVTATYGAGTTAGVATAVAVTWTEPVATPYCVLPSMVEDSSYFVTGKTTTGFTLTVSPRTALLTLAGGTVEILIVS